MIQVHGLGKRYGSREIFADLSFTVPEGGSLCLLGHSGCGKSTLLHILAGLDRLYSGEAAVSAAAGFSYVLQNYGLFPWKNVAENVGLPLRLRGVARPVRREAVARMLAELGLNGLERSYPSRLSGGQKQRVAIGRALITDPDVLLLDEPFSSLDAITREHLQNLLPALRRHRRFTTVLATHSIEEAVFLGRNILVLGGSPTHITAAFDNPGCGTPDYRSSDEFFRLSREVRAALQASAPAFEENSPC